MKSFLFRSASSVFLLAVFGYAVFSQDVKGYAVFAVAAIILSYLAVSEMCSLFSKVGKESFSYLAATTSAATVAVFLINNVAIGIAVILFACAQGWLIILLAKGRLETLEKVVNTVAAYFLLTIPFCVLVSIYMFRLPTQRGLLDGHKLLLFLVLATKAGDIGAYLVGSLSHKLMASGNHKMVPAISPGKSWEGTAGGLIFSMGVSVLLGPWAMVSHSYLILAALGFVLFLGGFVGDLCESSLKRICGVKDSGASLPGIGGALDLLDSLLLNAPIFALFMVIQLTYRWI